MHTHNHKMHGTVGVSVSESLGISMAYVSKVHVNMTTPMNTYATM